MKLHGHLLVAVLILASLTVSSQGKLNDSLISVSHFKVSYAYQVPGQELANRFGNNSNIGVSFNLKTNKNWYFGISSTFIFGNQVTEPGLLQNIANSQGHVIANDGKIARILNFERGYTLSAEAGKIFNVIGPNPNCGILLKGGLGFMQHKIFIEHQFDEITQLDGEYEKGYDRLTNGWQLNGFMGYYHQGNKKLVNFFAGIEAYQGFTAGRRDLNFDTGLADSEPRKDFLFGFRAGWIIQLYGRTTTNEYYY